jgi:hypothetical protein
MRLGLVVAACGLLVLAGCSGGVVGGNETEGSQQAGVAGAKLAGVVHGGQNPISGAHVYLFAAASGASGAGAAAYGGSGIAASTSNASQSLLNATSTGHSDSLGAYVATGSDGSFSISGDYTCTAGQQVYLYALGGDPGLGTGANAAAGLMAALGSCPTGGNFLSGTSPISYIVVNEVSTVAAAYAMAGFATDATHVGSSGTTLALTGIANAFANATNLETISTGVAPATTPAGNGTVPQAEINTLANILAACVNSNGTGSACTMLFTNATADGTTTGTQPTDTATAAINIAHNPAVNIGSLYGLASGTPPFAPALTVQPHDFTVALKLTGGGLKEPAGIAVDGYGNAWVGNAGGKSVTELSSAGGFLSGSGGYTGGGLKSPGEVAIDGSGNAWVTNNGSIVEFSNTGAVLSGASGYTGTVPGNPAGIAIDGSGNVWAVNGGAVSSVTEFSNAGAVLSGASGYTSAGMSYAFPIAIDSSGDAWIGNQTNGIVTKISSSGSILSGAGYGGGQSTGIAIDSSGDAWFSNQYQNCVTELSSSGATLSGPASFTGGSLGWPNAIAIDGSGNVWVANESPAPLLTELSSTGAVLSPNGYGSTAYVDPSGVAIDGSGNVWVSYQGTNAVAEFVGVGTPVVTPLAAGVKNNMLGTRP